MLKRTLLLAAVALLLSGCAAMHRLDSDVWTYSQWPAERKPSTYAFERLPSQQARPEQQQVLEDAARGAIESAGFTAAADAATADVRVQLGARVSATDGSPFDDPFWPHGGVMRWHGSFGYSSRFVGSGLGFGFRWTEPATYEREVMLLLRDRQSGQALFEAHASNSSASSAFVSLLPAMFAAALKDFPIGGVNPRRVSVDLGSR